MKSRYLILLSILLAASILLGFNRSDDETILYGQEIAVISHTTNLQGEKIVFQGYAKGYNNGCAVYLNLKDYYFDIKENAIWVEEDLINSDTIADYENLMSGESVNDYREKLKTSYGLVSIGGYVDYNNNGPDNAYAATLCLNSVSTEIDNINSTVQISSGASAENPINVSFVQLMSDPQRYNGIWIRLLGHWYQPTGSQPYNLVIPGFVLSKPIVYTGEITTTLSPFSVQNLSRRGIDTKRWYLWQTIVYVVGKFEVDETNKDMPFRFTVIDSMALHPKWEDDYHKGITEDE